MNSKLQAPGARLFKYHPERFFHLRDDPLWFEALDVAAREIDKDRHAAIFGIAERIYYFNEQNPGRLLTPSEENEFPDIRLAEAIDSTKGGHASTEETMVSIWSQSGRQIFDLSRVAALFETSDAADVPLASIKFPFDSFYVYWGRHLNMPSAAEGRYIDGCYVSRPVEDWDDSPIELLFTSTMGPDDRWHERSVLANIAVDAEGCIQLGGAGVDIESFRGIAESLEADGMYEEATSTRWKKFVPAALSMVSNCLCYLAWEKAEVVTAYPGEAPAKLVRQMSSSKPTEKRRAASKLENLGFREIHMCGERLAESIGLGAGSLDVPPHWRRGHWRHQRHGIGRAESKLIWINGLVVNADKGSPDMGHIYVP